VDGEAVPDSATLVSGGINGVFGSVFGDEQDAIDLDVRTGAINIDVDSIIDFVFAAPVVNAPGADLVLIDGRFDAGAATLSFDGSATEFAVASDAFVSSGITEDLLSVPGNTFTPFVASLDLSDFGFAPGASFTTLRLQTPDRALDLMAVASLSPTGSGGGGPSDVPLPATLPLLAAAAFATAALKRRRRSL